MTGADPRPLRFAVIGAGMAGILAAIRLREAGLSDVVIFEKADRVGGTWRENTYPGVACDVPSHLYCYSFEPNADWTRVFSPGAEIQAYFERVARDRGVLDLVRFGDEVVRCDWVDGSWELTTAGGARDRADVVIAATGVLHRPRLPEIEGLGSFAGPCFHSARWDHSAPLDGARVGIVGTGSTAVQIVAEITGRVGHLSLFQRTAQWVMPQSNRVYTDDERAALRREPERLAALHDDLARRFDGFANAIVDIDSDLLRIIEELCRENLERSVADPDLRDRLRPDYRAACKRLILSDGFYEAISRPNAELVTEPILRIEPSGVRTTDGRRHDLDVLVLATGFEVDAFVRPMQVTGRDGIGLDDVWSPRPIAYLSVSVPGFPNLFLLNGPNGPVGNFSLIEVAELQVGYVLQLVERLRNGECRGISATRAATEAHEAARTEATRSTVWATGCASWYLDDRGVPAVWPWSFERFRSEMARPRPEAFETI